MTEKMEAVLCKRLAYSKRHGIMLIPASVRFDQSIVRFLIAVRARVPAVQAVPTPSRMCADEREYTGRESRVVVMDSVSDSMPRGKTEARTLSPYLLRIRMHFREILSLTQRCKVPGKCKAQLSTSLPPCWPLYDMYPKVLY